MSFYVNELFRIEPELYDMMASTIEMGRAFIAKEYQQRPMPLFLLSMLSKEMGVAFVPVLILFELYFMKNRKSLSIKSITLFLKFYYSLYF